MTITLKKAGAVGALSVAALGIMSASAMGWGGMMGGTLSPDDLATRQNTMFTQHASLIGATVDEVKNAWAQGKSFADLAKEKGVTQDQLQTKLQSARLEQMKSELATLVSKGVITQAQADQRLTFMQNKISSGAGFFGRRGMHGGMGGMMGGGFGF